MIVRNAAELDFMRCVEIVRAAWPDFKERQSIYHLFCKHFRNTSFVAEEEGEIRAFLLGFLSQADPTQAYIHLVATAPTHQRRGFAEQLYRRFFAAVAGMGRTRVSLIVNPDNAGSLRFHRKLGFIPNLKGETVLMDGEMAAKDYNGPGLHMVPFEKELSVPGDGT